MTTARVVSAALYLLGVWIALSILAFQGPWTPDQPTLQAVRLVLMGVAGVGLFVCSVGAGTALLGLGGMHAKPEAAPRPYQPSA